MSSKVSKTHFEWLDMGKGLGMILVVAGHALSPGRQVYYLFHVVYFMMLSGFLYKGNKLFGQYLWKKVKSLYIPYVGWNLLVMLIRDGYGLLSANLSLSDFLEWRASHYYLVFLTFYKDGSYLGGIWFLGSLFLISIVYKLVDMIVPKVSFRQIIILGFFGILAGIGMHWNLPHIQSRTLVCSLFFAIGQALRLRWDFFKRFATAAFGILLLTMTCILSNFTYPGLSSGEYEHPVIFLICAFIGSFSLICFVVSLDKSRFPLFWPLKKLLSLFGMHSKEILIWHFILFRIVTVGQLFHEGLPLSVAFPTKKVYNTGHGRWIIYTIVGLFGSIGWGSFLRIGPWGWCLKKLSLID